MEKAEIVTVLDVVEMVASGRLDGFAVVRHRENPRVLRFRMRRGRRWDELWVDSSSVLDMPNSQALLACAMKTVLDQVSPG